MARQHIDEFAVSWTVSHTRWALGQETGAQQPIQTARGRGYRFVAEAVEIAAAPRALPLEPAVRAGTEPDPFVGRSALMEQLEARLARAREGHGALCLLVGEAGIGKTRCLDELAARAEALEFHVWTSRSIEASCGPVFWPWIQILHALSRDLTGLSETVNAIITRLMTYTELPDVASSALTPQALPMTSDRFWQYEAIVSLLHAAARQRSVLLTFDDLHWADRGTWELLGFLAPELRGSSILIAAARREDRGAAGRDPHAAQVRDAARFKLPSLGTPDVGRYLELRTGAPPSQALAEALRQVSAGNPWFLRETVEALLAQHGPEGLAALPASAIEPAGSALDRLRARIAALAPETRFVLQMASVLGDRFAVDVLARMGERPLEQVLAALEEGRAEGLIAVDPPRRARFCHALLRSVVYEDLALGERLRFHLLAARALEQTLDPLHYGEVAHHYQRALPLAEPARAAQAAARAAGSAARAHAHADAALFFEWTIEAQLSGPDDIEALLETTDVLLALPGELSPWLGLEARLAAYRAHLYRCDMLAADATLRIFGREAETLGLAEVVWFHDFFRAQRVFLQGELAQSEALFAELAERGLRLQVTQAPLLSAAASTLLTYEREGPSGVAKAGNTQGLLAGLFALPAVYAAYGVRLAAELGQVELARQVLYQLSQRDFAPVTKDLGYVNALANLALACVPLGDRALARSLYERLAPYARYNTQCGVVGLWEGAAARFLANVAVFLGEEAHAERYFDEAIALNEQIGSMLKLAETCYEYARWLFRRGRKTAALAFRQRSIQLAEQLGMQAVARSAKALPEDAR